VRSRHGAGSIEKERLRLLRNELLQRCMAVLLDQFAELSETGKTVNIPGRGTYLVIPRITLYAADMPEERHLQGLKIGLCHRPCSLCMIRKEECGEPRPNNEPAQDLRCVTETLTVQLEAASLYDASTGARRQQQISDDFSATHNVPALGAVHGLSTGCKNLYRIFGFDSLHVRWCVTGDIHLLCAHVGSECWPVHVVPRAAAFPHHNQRVVSSAVAAAPADRMLNSDC